MFSQGHISLKSSIKYCRTGSCKPLNHSGLIPCVSFTARAWDWCTVPLKAGRGWGAEGECEWGRERGREGVGDEHQGSLLCVLGAGRCVWIRLERSGTDNRVTLEDSNEQSWPGILLRGSLERPFGPWKTWKTLLTSEDSRGLGVLNRDTLFVCLLFVGIQKV